MHIWYQGLVHTCTSRRWKGFFDKYSFLFTSPSVLTSYPTCTRRRLAASSRLCSTRTVKPVIYVTRTLGIRWNSGYTTRRWFIHRFNWPTHESLLAIKNEWQNMGYRTDHERWNAHCGPWGNHLDLTSQTSASARPSQNLRLYICQSVRISRLLLQLL